jgi:hypothetical protein
MYEEGEADEARHLELNSAKEVTSHAMPYYGRLAIFKAFGAIMTAMSMRDFSASVIWSCIAFKIRWGFTSSTHDGKGPSSSPRSQD